MTFGSFDEVQSDLEKHIAVTLFTVLQWIPERAALRRIHSSHPEQYPVGGEKTFPIWPDWLTQCVLDQQSFLGADREAVRTAFFDHELIDSMGCGAFINSPVIDGGHTVAILNLLGPEYSYDLDDVRRTGSVAASVAHLIDHPQGEVL